MEEPKKESKPWSIIGKISVVLTALYALVAIYKEVRSWIKGDAEGIYYPYVTVPEHLQDTVTKQFKGDNYNSLYEVAITNNGDNPLEDIIFESPLKGFYKIIYPDSTVSKRFNNRFLIGSLRPSYQIKVLCWSENLPSDKVFDKVRITHKNGSFKVQQRTVSSLSDWFSLLFIIFLVVDAIVFYLWLKEMKKGIEKIKGET